MKNNKGFAHTNAILIILAFLFVGGLVYFLGKNDSKVMPDVKQQPLPIVSKTPMSTTLPQYISNQSGWPPVINNSAQPYDSCVPEENGMEEITEKIIDGKKYCVSVLIEGAAGSRYGRYTYVTASEMGMKQVDFILHWPNCQNYDAPEADVCQKNQDEFLGNLDALINNLMEV